MSNHDSYENDIAIIGMACRFPDAEDYNEFWDNLYQGKCSIKRIQNLRWAKNPQNEDMTCVYGGILDDYDKFDASFFNISPREAQNMDPQQRILLEETWHCIEDSEIPFDWLTQKKTSVYVGATGNDYDLYTLQRKDVDSYSSLGSFSCMMANRISHFLNLKGISITLDSACASSLVAIHQAKIALQSKESDFSVVAGVCLAYHPWRYIAFSKSHMMNINGECNVFDEKANGFIQGEGVGVLLLERAEEAIQQRHKIYGIIKGSAVNHNGESMTIAAPSVECQQDVILEAYKDAMLNPSETTYVEAHGTGTSLGDPIEIEALSRAFENYTEKKSFCHVGSVKANIGHTGSAAGIAGVIKVLLMFKNKKIIKTPNLKSTNPIINFDNSPFIPTMKNCNWVNNKNRLIATVSSFGFGGVNAHVILENYEKEFKDLESTEVEKVPFILSAKSESSLRNSVEKWKKFLNTKTFKESSIKQISKALTLGRASFDYRLGFTMNSKENLVKNLNNILIISKKENVSLTLELNSFCMENNLLYKHDIFSKLCKMVQKELNEKNIVVQKKHEEKVNRFIDGYTLFQGLLSAGIKIEKIVFNEETKFIALAISNVLDCIDIIKILNENITEEELNFKCPYIPLVDITTNKVLNPPFFSSSKLYDLINKIRFDRDFYEQNIDLSAKLYENQFTFKKNIDLYNISTKKYGIDIVQNICEKIPFNQENLSLKVTLFFAVSSLIQLGNKWNLKQSEIPLEYKILTQILLDDLISREELLEWIVKPVLEKTIREFIEKTKNQKYLSEIQQSQYSEFVVNELTQEEKLQLFRENHYSPQKTDRDFILSCSITNNRKTIELESLERIDGFLIELWKLGEDIKWDKIYNYCDTPMVPIPNYQFDRKRFWINENALEKENLVNNNPMIDSIEIRSKNEFVCKKVLSLEDFYLRDHIVGGKVVLPGVAYLEMALEAGKLCAGKELKTISEIMWIKPLIFEKITNLSLYIRINPNNFNFVIFTRIEDDEVIHAIGKLVVDFNGDLEPSFINFNEVVNSAEYTVNHIDCYRKIFGNYIGFDYGNGFRVTQEAYGRQNLGAEKLRLPEHLVQDFKRYILHPSLLDGALRTVTWIGNADNYKSLVMQVPFSLGKMTILGTLTKECYAIAELNKNYEQNNLRHYNVKVYDENGKEVLRVEDFILREMKKSSDVYCDQDSIKLYDRIVEKKRVENIYIKPSQEVCVFVEPPQNVINILSLTKINSILIYFGEKYEQKENIYVVNIKRDLSNQLKTIFENIHNNEKKLNKIIFFECDEIKNESAVSLLINKTCSFILQSFKYYALFQKSEKLEYIFICQNDRKIITCLFNAFSSLVKSLSMVNNKINIKSITFDDIVSCCKIRAADNRSTSEELGLEISGKVFAEVFQEIPATNKKLYMFKNNGFYLITGGLGKIGLLCTEYLLSKYNANIILIGRRELSEKEKRIINRLNEKGNVEYHVCDVNIFENVDRLIKKLKLRKLSINGILHCAGSTNSISITDVEYEDFSSVLQPKIRGTYNLDYATKNEKLDIFIVFSSISAIIGDYCRGNYSIANKFMDEFMLYRDSMVKNGSRYGRSISINWPVWEEGGMDVSNEEKVIYEEYLGLDKIPSKCAFDALEQAVSLNKNNILVLYGNKLKINAIFGKSLLNASPILLDKQVNEMSKNINANIEIDYLGEMIDYVKSAIEKVTGLNKAEMHDKSNLELYGIDSIMILDLNKIIEKDFPSIPKTLFFEYRNINDIANYLCNTFATEVYKLCGTFEEGYPIKNDIITQVQEKELVGCANQIEPEMFKDEIAVIGLSGKFPQAEDADELWDVLKEGKDCITEIPNDRWNHNKIYSEDKNEKNKVHNKYGGFISDIKNFDAEFFGISPSEARLIDPQERLFLEIVYHTLEDAGYTKEVLKRSTVGVYVGVMNGHYQLLGAEELLKGHVVDARTSFASIANRVSYYFDFNGPSIGVDTMCSSSLTAIYLACKSIQEGSCQYAIAGGVNLILHPQKYVFLSEQKFGSSCGRCKAFGKGGDGYVPAEGIGAVLLKAKNRAIADGDHIYGVIKASNINHGGRVNGYTVPNPNAQTKLICNTIDQAKINPESISYIEAHGTGTNLGDPIEVRSLTKAFGKYTNRKQYCAIGSIKANIGHTEAAAGIASLIKVLLQIKYKHIVPSLWVEELNENINFSETPFYIEKEYKPFTQNGVEPLRACISSFGAGGSNAHIIVEEYIDERPREDSEEEVILLSAKSKEALQQYAKKLKAFLMRNTYCLGTIYSNLREKISEICKIEKEQIDDFWDYSASKEEILLLQKYLVNEYHIVASLEEINTIEKLKKVISDFETRNGYSDSQLLLSDFAYTLQVGREEFEYRIAFVASNFLMVIEELNKISRKENEELIAYVNIYNKEKQNIIDEVKIKSMDLHNLAKFWEQGATVDWEKLNVKNKRQRISLPGYIFNEKSFWLPIEKQNNTSILFNFDFSFEDSFGNGIVFKGKIDSHNELIYEHIINGKLIVPGVIQIELVCQCFAKIVNQKYRLENVKWLRPLFGDGESLTYIKFTRTNNNTYDFEVQYENNDKYITVTSGKILTLSAKVDIQNFFIKKDQLIKRYTQEEIYDSFLREGINYGAGFQRIKQIEVWQNQLVAILDNNGLKNDRYVLTNPYIMDAALQAMSAVVGYLSTGKIETNVPYSIERIDKLSDRLIKFVCIKKIDDQWNIYLLDDDYQICILLSKVEIRSTGEPTSILDSHTEDKLITFHQYQWKPEIYNSIDSQENSMLIFTCPSAQFFANEVKNRCNDAYLEVVDLTTTKEEYLSIIDRMGKIGTIYYFDEIRSMDPLKHNDLRIFYLFKALWDSKYSNKKLHIKVITFDVCQVENRRIQNPNSGYIRGFLSSVNRENNNWNITYIDISSKEAQEYEKHNLITLLLREKGNIEGNEIAYNNGVRFIRTIEQQKVESDSIQIKNNGVYIILGGNGGIGYEISLYLAHTYNATIVWIGRSKIDSIKIGKMKEIEKVGGKIHYYQGDGTDESSMKNVIERIKQSFGNINGFIHAAVVLNDALLSNMSTEEYVNTLDSKMKSLIVSINALRYENLDFAVVFSSIQTFYGNIGQSNYAAGCTFQDTYGEYLQKEYGFPIKVIDWGFWGETGCASDPKYHTLLAKQGIIPISNKEGCSAFELIMSSKTNHAIVLKNGEQTVYEMKRSIKKKLEGNRKIDLDSSSKDEIENNIIKILSNLLEIEQEMINKDKRFVDYGLDSVTSLQFIEGVNEKYGLNIKTVSIFDYPNIKLFCDYVHKQIGCDIETNASKEKVTKSGKFDDQLLLERLANGSMDIDTVFNLMRDYNE